MLAQMLGLDAARAAMDDALDLSPLTDIEREAAAQELVRDGEPEGAKPTLPPADAEAPEEAAARLFDRPSEALGATDA